MLERVSMARYRALVALGAWYLAVQALLRVVLWFKFGRAVDVTPLMLLWIVPTGIVNDLVQSLYLLLGFALLLWLLPQRWYQSRAWLWTVRAGAFLWMFGLLFAAIAEYFFFEEFNARFNLVAVDYLIYPTEVIGDIRSEYPLGTVLIAVAVLAALSLWRLGRWLGPQPPPSTLRQRLAPLAAFAAAFTLCVLFVSADALSLSENRVANELAANGGSTFFRALRTSDIDYPQFYATRDSQKNFTLLTQQLAGLGGTFTRLDDQRLDRSFPARADGLGKLNVVVLVSESFGAEFSKLYGSTRDWTPEFDRYAQRGLWFRHMYASGTRTVRGLEAITASFPPIPSDSIVRRPGNDNVATWGKVMRAQGYQTSFLYGGYGYFDNMNAFYAANGFEVLDRKEIQQPVRFENVWGVSDEDLYDMALTHFDQLHASGQPFFAMIMNTSNHKPFTFREGVPGVKAAHGGRQSGVRYADFATGYLLRQAESHDWFRDTVFVVVADHGARVYGHADIPLKSYEIPMLIYSPAHIAPREVDSLTTQVDVAPTVLGLLGLPYTAPFFGRDVLHTPEAGRVAFFSHNHDVALLKDDKIAILGLQKSITDLRYDRDRDSYTRLPVDPELNDLAIAYYQTGYELYRRHAYE
ncbi:MAG: LTA synthase family protein [Steroidobacteraceae bacterium]